MERKGGGGGGRSERMAMVKMMRARGGAIDGGKKGEGASEGGSERGRRMDVGTEGEMKRGRQKVIKLDESGATGCDRARAGGKGLRANCGRPGMWAGGEIGTFRNKERLFHGSCGIMAKSQKDAREHELLLMVRVGV